MRTSALAIYIHIPYCRTICPYCDFVRRPLPQGAVPDPFVDALCGEIESFEGPDAAATVFFGGGTPSLISPESLERILAALRRRFNFADPEITIEANPDDVEASLVAAWRGIGVNRISLGVQSFDDAALRYLGRRHDAARAHRACEIVREQFENWSLDLIFGAPPVEAWEDTLRSCVALGPPHVSAYGLTYEDGTPFGKRKSEAVDEETSLTMYRQAHAALKDYTRYEISNFARPGWECRHNLVYWRNEAYAGFGPGAFSYVNGVRARNVTKTEAYLEAPGKKDEALKLSAREVRVETVIQYLRLRAGLPAGAYEARFGVDVREDFGAVIDGLIARGLIVEDAGGLRPTELGFELNNEIGLALV